MKVFSHLYEQVTLLENLFQAWSEFKKGKRKKIDVGYFERHLEDNIFGLHHALANKTYRHAPYTGFYIRDPKTRHIHKAVVRDRVIHHALVKILTPIFEPTLITDSYSCRKGYGTHKGFKRLVFYSRKVSKNYTRDCWVLKCDVKKFFDSVDHEILLELLGKRIKDPDLIWLVKEIVESYQTEAGKGIPIGNLTSQLFANIYLSPLDYYIKHSLKIKYYLRYADDFLLLHQDRGPLLNLLPELRTFLKESLQLELHQNKIFLRKLSWGIDFLGYVALPHHEVVRTKTKRRIFRKIREKINLYKLNQIDKSSLNQSINSYLGILKHANAHKLEQNLRNQIWFLRGDD